MRTSASRVSVVIPTHNRSASLARMLRALERQTFPLERLEVVVVADGCVDDTADFVRATRTAFPLQLVEQPGRGPAAARNAGARRAAGDVLLFLDDDIEPTAGVLAAHDRVRAASGADVVVGPSLPTFGRDLDFYAIKLRAWWHDQLGSMQRPGHRYGYRDVLSGNLSIDAELFHRVGGFDEVFWCRDDYELGLRLLAAGAIVAYAPDAVGLHHEQVDVERSFGRARLEGGADVLIGQRHPAIRRTLSLARPRGRGWRLQELPRRAAFGAPRFGDAAAAGLKPGLRVLERLRLRRTWRKLYGALHDFWYWRGCAAEIGSERALARFLADADLRESGGAPLDLDLAGGLASAEDLLDRVRPESLRVRLGAVPIGSVLPRPGSERIRGVHLRTILAEEMSVALIEALALKDAANLVADPAGLPSDPGDAQREDAPLGPVSAAAQGGFVR
ncbi:MAG: glycosyltransferase family 2 protein [Gemmatimonadota bacterium]